MGHRSYEPRRELEELLDSLEGVLVRSALFEGLTQREIAAELGTSKSRVNRLANDTDGPSLLRDKVNYAVATRMLVSRTPIVELAAARCWSAERRPSDPVPLAELGAAVDGDLASGVSLRTVAMARPVPGSAEAATLIELLRAWSRRSFVDVVWADDELRVGACVPQGVGEASSLLPRVPAATFAFLLGGPVDDVPREWLYNGLRPANIAVVNEPDLGANEAADDPAKER